MKLSDFLDVFDDGDMIEVYADDGVTRPCKIKLVDAFNISDWVEGSLDVADKQLEVCLDRKVTGATVVRLDRRGDDEVIVVRICVEQKEGDEDVRKAEDQDEGAGGKHDGQLNEKIREHLMYAYSVLRDFAKDMDGDWTMSKETAETLIQGAIDRIVAAGKCVGMNLNNYRED